MKNKFSSSVLYNGFIYGLDEAILACISAETGELKWKGGRYGYGQVLLAGHGLIVSTETGDIALADAYLLVRNAAQMACFKLGPR